MHNVAFGVAYLARTSLPVVRADARPAAVLARTSPPVVIADARPAAVLALTSLPVVIADARPAAVLALISLPVVLALPSLSVPQSLHSLMKIQGSGDAATHRRGWLDKRGHRAWLYILPWSGVPYTTPPHNTPPRYKTPEGAVWLPDLSSSVVATSATSVDGGVTPAVSSNTTGKDTGIAMGRRGRG